jgi:hypothetical protein
VEGLGAGLAAVAAKIGKMFRLQVALPGKPVPGTPSLGSGSENELQFKGSSSCRIIIFFLRAGE